LLNDLHIPHRLKTEQHPIVDLDETGVSLRPQPLDLPLCHRRITHLRPCNVCIFSVTDLGFARGELRKGGGDEEEVTFGTDGEEMELDVGVEKGERAGGSLRAGGSTFAGGDL
jgi:hypothetical protein